MFTSVERRMASTPSYGPGSYVSGMVGLACVAM